MTAGHHVSRRRFSGSLRASLPTLLLARRLLQVRESKNSPTWSLCWSTTRATEILPAMEIP